MRDLIAVLIVLNRTTLSKYIAEQLPAKPIGFKLISVAPTLITFTNV
jgi:hypothetical protein